MVKWLEYIMKYILYKFNCMYVLLIYIWFCVDIVIGKFVYDKTI